MLGNLASEFCFYFMRVIQSLIADLVIAKAILIIEKADFDFLKFFL